MTGKLHDADLVLIEGDGYNVYCDYAPVEGKRSDIVKRMLQVAKSPYKTYRVLANKLSCDDEHCILCHPTVFQIVNQSR